MRNPDRIEEVLNAVEEEWREHPDMRLGQLLWKIAGGDPFFLEDDELVRRLTGEDPEFEYFSGDDDELFKGGHLYNI